MLLGIPEWITNRTSGLSIPMPKATVATTTSASSARNRSWLAARSSLVIPAWYGTAFTPSPHRAAAVWSTFLREMQ